MNSKRKLPKILFGFDFGMKRIGIAVGQTITQTARPLASLQAKRGSPDWPKLTKLISKWLPDAFIVGIPLNMDGTAQKITFNARQFANMLRQKYELPVYEIDERLTTKDARERLFSAGGFKSLQDGQVDQVAAQLILQNWFAEKMPRI